MAAPDRPRAGGRSSWAARAPPPRHLPDQPSSASTRSDFAAVARAIPYSWHNVRIDGTGSISPDSILRRKIPATCWYTGSSHSLSMPIRAP